MNRPGQRNQMTPGKKTHGTEAPDMARLGVPVPGEMTPEQEITTGRAAARSPLATRRQHRRPR